MPKTIVIFSGAGLSAESGIPTFRDSDGLWENHKVEDVASPEGWKRNPQIVLDFYAARLHASSKAEPNAAHCNIARLQEKYKVVNITQNVDNLLERAGCTDVRHLHGSLFRRKCEHHYDISNLEGDMQFTCNYKADQTEPVQLGEKCPKCQGQLRPDVVWFGEAVDMQSHVRNLVKETKDTDGAFICIGTSAQVFPAAFLLNDFFDLKHKYIVNKKCQPIGDYKLYEGNASEQMKILTDSLLDSATPIKEL